MVFNIDKSIKKIIGTPKKRGGKKDWDGDGVLNKFDCQPRNTMRQDTNKEFIIIDKRVEERGVTPSGLKRMDTQYELVYNPRFKKYGVVISTGGYGRDFTPFKDKEKAKRFFETGVVEQ